MCSVLDKETFGGLDFQCGVNCGVRTVFVCLKEYFTFKPLLCFFVFFISFFSLTSSLPSLHSLF